MELEELEPQTRDLVDTFTAKLVEEGAKAVALTGSFARGTATPDSDVDLFVVGEGPVEQRELSNGRLIGIHWFTPEAVRERLNDPEQALIATLAWRDALVVHDPDGIAAELRHAACAWSWDDIAARADLWVREQLLGQAEYAAKIRRALDEERLLDAGALSAEITAKLARVVAVANRLNVESENGFWESVAAAAGPEWQRAFEEALGEAGSIRESAQASLRLFALVVERSHGLLDESERALLAHMLEAAGLHGRAAG